MYFSILGIQKARISRLFSGLQGQYFSNNKLNIYVEELLELFNNLQLYIDENEDNLSNLTSEFRSVNSILNFIIDSIEFLEDSIIDVVPFETIYCLERALNDWLDEHYIIVVSYKRSEYFFSSLLSDENNYQYIYSKYGVKFTHRLIQISIPKYEVNDYLFNVILYHELGHFVDSKHNISSKIAKQESLSLPESERVILKNHYAEYFADIFAAQYISKYASTYLEYFAGDDGDSYTHPSTVSRSIVVAAFLDGVSNPIVEIIKNATRLASKREIKIRYEAFGLDDFTKLLPARIETEGQLHYVFIAGWKLWLENRESFPVSDNDKLYKIINNFLEKTISNYMVESLWKEANVS